MALLSHQPSLTSQILFVMSIIPIGPVAGRLFAMNHYISSQLFHKKLIDIDEGK
jgi:hypothetical protein